MLAAAKRALGVGPTEAESTAGDSWRGRRLGPAGQAFRATLDFIDLISRAVLIAMFSGELGLILIEILRRELFDQSFLWLEEVSRIVLLAIAFIGGPLAY
ncbi:MAG: TRAP transporter small permease subunit, partial [Acetobacteraceae bacterium]